MDELALIVDLHRSGARQGPGSDDATRLALSMTGLGQRNDLVIADIGCGTGASTLVLARSLDAQIHAVDFLPEFLSELETGANKAGLSHRIETLAASMDALPFEDGSLDAIWSEGAVYNMGFAAGVSAWRRFLKPGGIIAVSELTWLTAERPRALTHHWNAQYPEVDTAAAKLGVLEAHGYAPLGYFALGRECWLDAYYRPMQARFDGFLARHGRSRMAQDIVTAEEAEIALYEAYSDHVSYGFYVARRTD